MTPWIPFRILFQGFEADGVGSTGIEADGVGSTGIEGNGYGYGQAMGSGWPDCSAYGCGVPEGEGEGGGCTDWYVFFSTPKECVYAAGNTYGMTL